jgi:hypothetical protein
MQRIVDARRSTPLASHDLQFWLAELGRRLTTSLFGATIDRFAEFLQKLYYICHFHNYSQLVHRYMRLTLRRERQTTITTVVSEHLGGELCAHAYFVQKHRASTQPRHKARPNDAPNPDGRPTDQQRSIVATGSRSNPMTATYPLAMSRSDRMASSSFKV